MILIFDVNYSAQSKFFEIKKQARPISKNNNFIITENALLFKLFPNPITWLITLIVFIQAPDWREVSAHE